MSAEGNRLWGVADRRVELPDGQQAYFGRDVLRGLVDGLREASARPRNARSWVPAVLACAMWMDDPELIAVLREMANVCVLVTKQRSSRYLRRDMQAVRGLAEDGGLAQAAFPELADVAPASDGRPLAVGPWTPDWRQQSTIGAVREVGYRQVEGRLVPIVHAKMALLGRMGWSDEHPLGYADDHIFFVAERLWVGSANFTKSSRRGLEMGYWTTDNALMQAARRFLLALVSLSEPIGVGPPEPAPELVPVEWDDAAFAEYLGEHPYYEDCHEEEP